MQEAVLASRHGASSPHGHNTPSCHGATKRSAHNSFVASLYDNPARVSLDAADNPTPRADEGQSHRQRRAAARQRRAGEGGPIWRIQPKATSRLILLIRVAVSLTFLMSGIYFQNHRVPRSLDPLLINRDTSDLLISRVSRTSLTAGSAARQELSLVKRLLQSRVGFREGRSSSLKHWLADDVALRRHARLALVSVLVLGRGGGCGR